MSDDDLENLLSNFNTLKLTHNYVWWWSREFAIKLQHSKAHSLQLHPSEGFNV